MDPDEHVSYNTSNNATDKDPAQSESGDVSPIKDAISSDPSSLPVPVQVVSEGSEEISKSSDLSAHVEASLAGADFGAGSNKVEDHNKTPISSPPVTPVTPSTALTPEQLEEYYRSVPPLQMKQPSQLGAWAKPLHFTPPATPPDPSTPRVEFAQLGINQSSWASLKEGLQEKPRRKQLLVGKTLPPTNIIPPHLLKPDGSHRFPWAAKMDPSKRNLFRAANPTFRIDGTPEVIIPSKVLLLGPENHDEYIIGQFHRCALPPGGLVHAVVNKLWGRSCRIAIKKHGDSSFMFHIPHEATRKWVIERGVWHIDDCLLFVAPWSPAATLKTQEISTLPVWVNLKNIPDRCYSCLGISHIASGLGEPILTHKPRLDPTEMGGAKILVEMELDKSFPKLIACDDKQGNIYLVEVEYTWIPSTCVRCGNLGHKEKRCLLPPDVSNALKHKDMEAREESSNVPIVNIDQIGQSSLQPTSSQEKCTSTATLPNTHEAVRNVQKEMEQDIQEETMIVQGIDSQIKEVTLSHSTSTFSSLSGASLVPSDKNIMEETPSCMVIDETTNSEDDVLNDPYLVIPSMDHSEGEPQTQMTMTRGGRLIKQTQKAQEMEWTKVKGRGKYVSRGRGNRNS
ncbi:hypothetical protein N665_1392s0005 [Sinapis alba]|nr:hypothetical protein N665_1392s0005 [Sinapis alba]